MPRVRPACISNAGGAAPVSFFVSAKAMHTLLLIIAIHALLFGFAFSFAGWCTLIAASDAEEAEFKESYQLARRQGWFKAWLCYRQFRRNFASFPRLAGNWTNRTDARKLVFAGLACLAIAAILGFPLGAYK